MKYFDAGMAMVVGLLIVGMSAGCRTNGDEDKDVKSPLALTPEQLAASPILKKATGDVTRKYATNRIEDCVILRRDIPNLAEVDQAIADVKTQQLADAFIFRAQIPSIQYFAYQGTDAVLLSETNDEKMKFRRPASEVGNPSLDILMNILQQKCGTN